MRQTATRGLTRDEIRRTMQCTSNDGAASLEKTGANMLEKHPWSKVEMEELNPLISRQMLSGAQSTIARVYLKKGAIVPRHSHHNEQITFILDGALKFTFDDGELVLNKGEVLLIPSHVPHAAEAVVDTDDLDIFIPRREDWINKEDSYLRGGAKK